MELFTNQVLAGIATGAIYACMALAVVMIYQAIDHLNFAQGEMAMFSVDLVVSGAPSNSMAPVERTMLQIARSVVVLPAPLAPSSVVSDPSLSEKLRPCSAWTWP